MCDISEMDYDARMEFIDYWLETEGEMYACIERIIGDGRLDLLKTALKENGVFPNHQDE